jgi:hypothetical protein
MRKRDLFLIPAMSIVGCGGTLWGAHNSYVTLQNRAPVEISCAEYLSLKRPPAGSWLRLTDCSPDFRHMTVETFTSKGSNQPGVSTVSAVYVPLRAARGSTAAPTPTRILLVGDDNDMLALGRPFAQVSDQLVVELSTAVEGLVQRGLDLSQRRRTEIAQLNPQLAEDFVIVDRGARPRPLWFAAGELGLGLTALTLLRRRIRRWFRGGAASLPYARIARERIREDNSASD